MLILTADEIRAVETNCFKYYSTEAELMLKAGTACADSITEKYGDKLINRIVSVFCGNGKNAGDGFVIARLLYAYGANAKIVLCDKAPEIAEPLKYYNEAVSSGVPVEYFGESSANADFIVDCIFGIGFHGEARSPFDKIFESVNKSVATVISVDTPSGTNATDGLACKNAVKADFTIAISTLKYCHVLPPSNALCGEIKAVNIGISEDCYSSGYAQTITQNKVKNIVSPLDFNSNKGSNGHLLCLCGSYKMPGAAVICCKSAIRSGAGLVKLTMPQSAYPIVASHLVQPIFNPVEESNGMYSEKALEEIPNDMQWASAIVLGCGMGVSDDTRKITEFVLKNSKVPVILDADGINCITSSIDILKDVKVPVVLTPHPGEMSRLVSKSVGEVQSDRIGIAKDFAKEYGVTIVLKGANTVVTDGETVFVNMSGNPAMAMGGTGDMLSGIIGSFVAQGINPYDAAKAGVFIHGCAGDEAAKAVSQRGITVFDMIDRLGALMSEY